MQESSMNLNLMNYGKNGLNGIKVTALISSVKVKKLFKSKLQEVNSFGINLIKKEDHVSIIG